MDKNDFPDPDPTYVSLEDIEKSIRDGTQELVREITELKLEIEEQRWWRWGVAAALIYLLWKTH